MTVGNQMRPHVRIKTLPTLVQLADFAVEWTTGELCYPEPKLVFMTGEMGSGKTSFVSKVADVFGALEAASPSFALHTRYDGPRGIIDHFDLDRIESRDDLESTGFWDILSNVKTRQNGSQNFAMIEWASRLDQFGLGLADTAWTKGFRVSSFSFSGPPEWRLEVSSPST